MPSRVMPQRRSREDDSDCDQNSSPGEEQSSRRTSRKRARFSNFGQSEMPASGVLTNAANGSSRYDSTTIEPRSEHQPGAIVRVKLENFVTYTAAEFHPGPTLNMVIGPNGTGKSTLVCAICIGLGWSPSHLGRAKDVGEFVKHGQVEATIEIELKKKPDSRRNPVIKCVIRKENNKTAFFLKGKPSTKQNVMNFCKSLSIQIDNLCQFLPQDKVVEFAAMTPVELLKSTQRAVGSEEMLSNFALLVEAREAQRKIQEENESEMELLAEKEKRQKQQEADVERLRERESIKTKIVHLETSRNFVGYRESAQAHKAANEQRLAELENLMEVERELEPVTRDLKAKEMYRDHIAPVLEERKKRVAYFERKLKEVQNQAMEWKQKIEEKGRLKKHDGKEMVQKLAEEAETEKKIAKVKELMQSAPPEFDVTESQAKIRAKEFELGECRDESERILVEQKGYQDQIDERNHWIQGAENQIRQLESQAGQQQYKLNQISTDAAKAWRWIQANQNLFEKKVFGPPIVECSIKDARYATIVESLFNQSDLTSFTCQSRGDFAKLNNQLYKVMNLHRINIRTITNDLNQVRPPASDDERKRFGFDGWALDFVSGPDPVLAMLCYETPKLHLTGVALEDTTDQQFELISNSNIASWATSKSIYKITRRREYGPGATSTSVKDTPKVGRIWTDQPVDMTQRLEQKRKIDDWEDEKRTLADKIEQLNERIAGLRKRRDDIRDEQNSLRVEKEKMLKIQKEWDSYPERLDQYQRNLDDIRKIMSESEHRIREHERKSHALTMEKANFALKHVKYFEELLTARAAVDEAEIALIEATSDAEILLERNSAAMRDLNEKRKEVKDLSTNVDALKAKAVRAKNEAKRIMREATAEFKQFVTDLPEEMTSEDLEAEIESEQARLDLMHEGNGGRVLAEFEQRQKEIAHLQAKLKDAMAGLDEITAKVAEYRSQWEPELERLVKRISKSFEYNMKQINCLGEVGIRKDDEDFDKWAIEIRVKFREDSSLAVLNANRQSGGERAVSTIFYLMSLQALTRSPFRVVDEINQGMDPTNERLVHARMVGLATGNDEQQFHDEDEGEDEHAEMRRTDSQYFLITPKLLPGLRYERGMKVLCIASGEYMPTDQSVVDFAQSLATREAYLKQKAASVEAY